MLKSNIRIFCFCIIFTIQLIVSNLFIHAKLTLPNENGYYDKYFFADDIHLYNPNNIEFVSKEKLLKYEDLIVLASYKNNDDLSIYDVTGKFLNYFSVIWDENRYFSKKDYKNSLNVYINVAETSDGCKYDLNTIVCLFDSEDLPSKTKVPKIKNFFYETKNINDIYISGKYKKEAADILLSDGFVIKENTHLSIIKTILSLLSGFRNVFLIIVCLINNFSIFLVLIINIKSEENKQKIRFLLGESYKIFLKNHILTFTFNISLFLSIICLLVLFLKNSTNIIYLDYKNIFNIYLFYMLFISTSNFIFKTISYRKIESDIG
ncbi:MAG: hypothetical protein MR601_06215 [Erysipelotrichaceae bacterium]|nr:hypothetical protein [Erysipelotrichaceae bacterium]